jgi:hypothetical protein
LIWHASGQIVPSRLTHCSADVIRIRFDGCTITRAPVSLYTARTVTEPKFELRFADLFRYDDATGSLGSPTDDLGPYKGGLHRRGLT